MPSDLPCDLDVADDRISLGILDKGFVTATAGKGEANTVIAPDLRGFGESSTPTNGYTKAEMAQDVHALMHSLGYDHSRIVGHDIGLMVAYAYAAQYPKEVDRIVLMDAFLPGVGNWKDVWLMRDLWHFHFYGKTPLALVQGRERIYFEQLLGREQSNMSRVAERAGLERTHLYRKLKQLSIRFARRGDDGNGGG